MQPRRGQQQNRRRRQRRSSNSSRISSSSSSSSASSASSPGNQIYRAATTWSGNYEDEDEDEDEYLIRNVGVLQQNLSFSGSPAAITSSMVYQYVFEEGLELSLVPENEAPPFSAGPKVLELGLCRSWCITLEPWP
jgi:hypothetical protein